MSDSPTAGQKDPRARNKKLEFYSISVFYTRNIYSLLAFINQIGKVAEEMDTVTGKQLMDLLPEVDELSSKLEDLRAQLQQLETNKEEPSGPLLKTYSETLEKYLGLSKIINQVTSPQGYLLRRGALILAVSYFEVLLSQLISAYYHNYPNALPDEQTLKLSEIRDLGSLVDAEAHVIDREAENVMRRNTREQLEYFRNKLHVDLSPLENYINELVEISLRRNIIVHNDGEVNRFYLKTISAEYVKAHKIIEGMDIPVGQKYVVAAINRFLVVGQYLIQKCWRQWKKEKVNLANYAISGVIFEQLKRSEYKNVVELSEFALSLTGLEDRVKRIMTINRAIALRELSLFEQMNQLLDASDWSACSLEFQIALQVLRHDEASLYTSMEKALEGKVLSPEEIREWPLFLQLRENAEFQQWAEKAIGGLTPHETLKALTP